MYIYKIENKINHRVYIGLTSDFRKRRNKHRSELSKGMHSNPNLQSDYDYYGKDVFLFSVIENCSEEDGKDIEDYWIEYFGGIESNLVYNCQNNKQQNKLMVEHQNAKKIGRSMSESFKSMMRDKMIVNNPMRGKHHTDVTRKKLSESHLGEKNHMYGKTGEKSPNYGRKHSKQAKEKCRLANLGKRKYDNDFIEKLRGDYRLIGTYSGVAEKYNINVTSVTNLIKYGTPAKPSYYK